MPVELHSFDGRGFESRWRLERVVVAQLDRASSIKKISPILSPLFLMNADGITWIERKACFEVPGSIPGWFRPIVQQRNFIAPCHHPEKNK